MTFQQNFCACLLEGKDYKACVIHLLKFLHMKEKVLQDETHPQLIPIYEALGQSYLGQV